MQNSFYNLIWSSEAVCYLYLDFKVGVMVLIKKMFEIAKRL
jgi:hypothetical protein